jgi:four helix bundle protein
LGSGEVNNKVANGIRQGKIVEKKIERFEDLKVWRKAHELVLKTYQVTRDFPNDEKFGLVSQMRRAGVSIAANIAEGFKRRTLKDKSNFYNISQGSLEELRYYLLLSVDLGYLRDDEKLQDLSAEIGRMLHGLIKSIR